MRKIHMKYGSSILYSNRQINERVSICRERDWVHYINFGNGLQSAVLSTSANTRISLSNVWSWWVVIVEEHLNDCRQCLYVFVRLRVHSAVVPVRLKEHLLYLSLDQTDSNPLHSIRLLNECSIEQCMQWLTQFTQTLRNIMWMQSAYFQYATISLCIEIDCQLSERLHTQCRNTILVGEHCSMRFSRRDDQTLSNTLIVRFFFHFFPHFSLFFFFLLCSFIHITCDVNIYY